jgi:hypothetical protein
MENVCVFPLIQPQEETNKSNLAEVNISSGFELLFEIAM